MDKLMMM